MFAAEFGKAWWSLSAAQSVWLGRALVRTRRASLRARTRVFYLVEL